MADKFIRIVVTVPPVMADRVNRYLAEDRLNTTGMDRSQLVREAVDEYLNQKGA